MKNGIAGIVALFVVLVAVVVGYSSLFTVSETQQVLLVRLGEPVRVVTTPVSTSAFSIWRIRHRK